MVSDCLVPSIDEAPRVKDFNSRYSLQGRDENALVTAVKRGQTSAFNELWQSHSSRLYWTTFRITRNRRVRRNRNESGKEDSCGNAANG